MESEDLVGQAERHFLATVEAIPHAKKRAGQHQLAMAVAETLAAANFAADAENQLPQILLAEAGTGTGKTVAALVPALTVAKARGVRLVVSTATISLQEQYVNKDLPMMAAAYPGGFTFALAKGRGRYACPVKLETSLGTDLQGSLELDANDAAPKEVESDSKTVTLYRKLSEALQAGEWNGDRDALPDTPLPKEWTAIAADRSSCTGRRCPQFQRCPYYVAKRQLRSVDVIVTNHSLLISSLVHNSGVVPTPDKAIYVLDEGHHVPGVAIGESELETGLTSALWPQSLGRALRLAVSAGLCETRVDTQMPRLIEEGLHALEQLCADLMEATSARDTYRFVRGEVPESLAEVARELHSRASAWLTECQQVVDEVKGGTEGDDPRARRANSALVELATHLAQLEGLVRLLSLFADIVQVRCAKWISSFTSQRGRAMLRLHCCPLSGAPTLNRVLWSRARGVVVMSATMRTLGSFTYFRTQSGLAKYQVRCEAVQSPFDFERQGKIVVSKTAVDPSGNLARFVDAVLPSLFEDMRRIQHGGLVLFSSRAMMEQVVQQLPADLEPLVLVQGKGSRELMLKRHRKRIADGKISVLLGLQSLGEGLDLVGRQCEVVLIPKVPFACPTSPVDEARAEYVQSRGGNPFQALSVPETALKLTQWVGRLIRSEEDSGTIIFYDPRLVTKSYGRQMLDGLPPFAREVRTS